MTVIDQPRSASQPSSTSARSPWAKVRILETANVLFYEDGIRSVGVDRLIVESSVTKATFYKHYGSKDTLIVDYIKARHQSMETGLTALIADSDDAEDALRRFIDAFADDIASPGYRGSAFLNAAAEFSDPTHVVRKVVQTHRDWMTAALTDLLTRVGHPMPGDGADELLLAIDGAQSGGYAGDPIAASAALGRVVERVIHRAAA